MENEAALTLAKTQQKVLEIVARQKQQLKQFAKIIEQKDAEIKKLNEEKNKVAPNPPKTK